MTNRFRRWMKRERATC
ncbi:hypothetical protein [Noviherbaspirillum pedocola]